MLQKYILNPNKAVFTKRVPQVLLSLLNFNFTFKA